VFSLAVASETKDQAQQVLDAHWQKDLSPEEREISSQTIDVDEETWTCPACLTPFERGPTHCPACGLYLGL